jgi:hypothetical protein
VCLQLLSHLGHQLRDTEPFVGLHAQRTIKEIREELIAVYLAFQFSAVQQSGDHSNTQPHNEIRSPLSSNPPICPGSTAMMEASLTCNFPHAVGEIMGKLSLNEQPIHAIVVQTMTEGGQLVIMDNTDQWVQYGASTKRA